MQQEGITGQKAFTLIEVLVAIAIVAMLTILFIPNINRSLSKNNLAGDAQLLSSKIESARLLAGSTQRADNSASGYYGIYLPPGVGSSFAIIRATADVSNPLTFGLPCNPEGLISITTKSAMFPDSCVVETVTLSPGVTLNDAQKSFRFIFFRAPAQQVYFGDNSIDQGSVTLSDRLPDSFSAGIQLRYGSKTATIHINNATGQVESTTYADN